MLEIGSESNRRSWSICVKHQMHDVRYVSVCCTTLQTFLFLTNGVPVPEPLTVGMPRLELGLPAPKAGVLPLYYIPIRHLSKPMILFLPRKYVGDCIENLCDSVPIVPPV